MHNSEYTQRGFTLIELLIALAVGGLLAGLVLSIFKYQTENHELQEEYVALEQNLRGAMEVITKDLRMTGLNLPAAINAVDTGTLDLLGDQTLMVESDNDANRNNADALTTKKATTDGLNIVAYASTTFDVCSPSNLQTGQLFLLVNAGKAEWRSINIKSVAINGGSNNVQCSGSGNNADQITFDDNPKVLNSTGGLGADFNGGAVFPLAVNSYYIEPDADGSTQPGFIGVGVDNDPALMMVQNYGNPVVLAFGITNMQISYFEDANPNDATAPPETTTPVVIGNIRMIQISLTGQTQHSHKIGRTGFRTRTLTTTVRMRNTL